jgi:hypothetical protein
MHQKSCISVFPGAGHMYIGLQKRGLQLMLLFLGFIYILDDAPVPQTKSGPEECLQLVYDVHAAPHQTCNTAK